MAIFFSVFRILALGSNTSSLSSSVGVLRNLRFLLTTLLVIVDCPFSTSLVGKIAAALLCDMDICYEEEEGVRRQERLLARLVLGVVLGGRVALRVLTGVTSSMLFTIDLLAEGTDNAADSCLDSLL